MAMKFPKTHFDTTFDIVSMSAVTRIAQRNKYLILRLASNIIFDVRFLVRSLGTNFRKNALGVKRPFAELSESSGAFSEQLSEFKITFSEWHPTTWAIRKPQFPEQLPEPFPELLGTYLKDFHLPQHSRNVFFKNWGGPRTPDLK